MRKQESNATSDASTVVFVNSIVVENAIIKISLFVVRKGCDNMLNARPTFRMQQNAAA